MNELTGTVRLTNHADRTRRRSVLHCQGKGSLEVGGTSFGLRVVENQGKVRSKGRVETFLNRLPGR